MSRGFKAHPLVEHPRGQSSLQLNKHSNIDNCMTMERSDETRRRSQNCGETPPVPLILYEKNGQAVYVPANIADLLRDLPPETDSFSFEDDPDVFNGDEKGSSTGDEAEIEGGFNGVEIVGETDETSENYKNPKPLLSSSPNNNNQSPFLWSQLKSSGGKLIPFLKTLALYFLLFFPEDSPSWGATAVKCLPILSLALFVLLHGVSNPHKHKFSRRILAGLLFSCLGDALLIWPNFFLHGMAAFGVAQVFYIRAFGFKPLNIKLGAGIYLASFAVLLLIGPGIMAEPPLVAVGVFLYIILLLTMVWRSISRLQLASHTGEHCSGLCGVAGGIFFLLSDTCLSLNRFYVAIPYHQVLIMGTYYTAQLSIALSILRPLGLPAPSSPQNHHHLKVKDH